MSITSNNNKAAKTERYFLGVLSLLATPALLFISTSVPLFLNNQTDLNYQLSVLKPFIFLFLFALGIGVSCWFVARPSGFRIILWAYYLIGPFFLLFTALRNSLIPALEGLLGIIVFIVTSLILTFVLSRRFDPYRATGLFAVMSVLFLSADIYRLSTELDWNELHLENENVNHLLNVLNVDADKPNIYHIILDAFQSDVFTTLLTDELRTELNGFVYYSETSAVYSLTTWSVPSIMLGQHYDFSISHTEYQNQAFNSDQSLLYSLKQAGYQTLAYTRKLYPFRFKYFDQTIQHTEALQEKPSYNREFLSMWTYRYLPTAITLGLMKHGFLIESADLESFRSNTFLADSAPLESYLSFQEFLATESQRSNSGRYTFLHLLLPHGPYVLNPDCVVSKKASVISQSECAIDMIYALVNELKKLNRYDNSLILIHGDHGDKYKLVDGKFLPIKHRSHRTLLLVKPGSNTSTKDLVISNAETTLLDIAPTILAFVKQKTPQKMEGLSLLNVHDLSERRMGQRSYFMPSGSGNYMKQYLINGNSLTLSKKISIDHADSAMLVNTDVKNHPAMSVGQVIEAEDGILSAAVDVKSNLPDTNNAYVISGTVGFKFIIQTAGKYQLRARLITPNGNNNSSFLSLDGKQKHTWHMSVSKQWMWQNATIEWQLSKGEHMIVLDYREPVYLDQVELVNISVP